MLLRISGYSVCSKEGGALCPPFFWGLLEDARAAEAGEDNPPCHDIYLVDQVEADPDHARMASLAANQGAITELQGQSVALREDSHGFLQLGQISTSLFLVVQLTLELLVQYSFSIQITFLIWLVGAYCRGSGGGLSVCQIGQYSQLYR